MVDIESVNRWISFVLSLPVVIEALALLIGINFIAKNREWGNIRNNIMLVADIITGIILLVVILTKKEIHSSIIFYIILTTIIALHMIREIEYFTSSNPQTVFCANNPLFIVNSVKLALALIVLALALAEKIK